MTDVENEIIVSETSGRKSGSEQVEWGGAEIDGPRYCHKELFKLLTLRPGADCDKSFRKK